MHAHAHIHTIKIGKEREIHSTSTEENPPLKNIKPYLNHPELERAHNGGISTVNSAAICA